jgi:hypothetical protein
MLETELQTAAATRLPKSFKESVRLVAQGSTASDRMQPSRSHVSSNGTEDVEAAHETAWSRRHEPCELTERELTDILRRWPNFGCFSIAVCHPWRPLSGALIKLCAFCVILAQLLIPVSLLVSLEDGFETSLGSWCPGGGRTEERVLAAAICLMYFSQTFLSFYNKITEMAMNDETDVHDGLPEETANAFRARVQSGVLQSRLNDFGQVDEFMHVSYDALLHLLNIWLVFQSRGTVNVISNCLITQFAMALDDEFKVAYFAQFNGAIRAAIARKWHCAGSALWVEDFRCGCNAKTFALVLLYLPEIGSSLLLGGLVPVVCAVCVFYVPICKP